MSRFDPPALENHLQGKVVVLTGGALGIGSELVRLLHSSGASIFFGDVLITQGEALAKELSATSKTGQHVSFLYCNVQSHLANLGLFDLAMKTCGRVDHAASVAGINREEDIASKELDMESVRKEPDIDDSIDVNLRGPILFSRIAGVYLRQPPLNDKSSTAAADKSLTLVSSVAGFTEAPGLAIYSSAKHGVYGLMRALRKVLIKSSPYAIRTNAVCPWMTETRMVKGIDADWREAGLPRNKAIEVARVIAGVMVANSLNGEALYVEGGRAWGIEEGIDRTQPQWMGEKQSRDFLKGQEVLGTGESW
ncbi:putative 3-hydroxyacyl-CoA dehydrogenase [Aureobasidium pullulans]|uniref:Putative 3-hydroxyacyl-CoA dehydrogenase n=1 Tax=Aureobasidium pullulans TaxID=5580 RepID=A0A4S8ZH39_AURPU|nr:putative 3-hydroxyacyl-CoA dehydrogenase [Aureobasidium pullulans]